MKNRIGFWMLIAVAQLLYGAAVFGVARHLYRDDVVDSGKDGAVVLPPIEAWEDTNSGLNERLLETLGAKPLQSSDPAEISRRANDYFQQQNYVEAARLYEQLLAFEPSGADVHNNLALTLHYLGRSNEALSRLDEGIQLDPKNQRIWLTKGFVNSQLGNTAQARAALDMAISLGADTKVGKSARQMIDNLPQ